MIKLNDNNIVVGQIKQILSTFNLPQCQVGSLYPKAGMHFLTKHHIMRWDNNLNVIPSERYVYGREYLNLTSTLPISNMIYDATTHRYLGKYLRFLRDYHGLNLMSMYNCWDGTENSRDFELKIGNNNIYRSSSFRSGDEDSVVYKVPVSITEFTIAITGSPVVEMCVYIDANFEINSSSITKIAELTYMKRKLDTKINYSPFNRVFNADIEAFITQNVNNLYLLIKIPRSNTGSITVLEGNYASSFSEVKKLRSYRPIVRAGADGANVTLLAKVHKSIDAAQNDETYNVSNTDDVAILLANRSEKLLAINPENFIFLEPTDSGHIPVAQLLSLENMSSKYVLADRLIEYLTGNVITPISEYYDIERIQKALNILRSNDKIMNDANNPKAYNQNTYKQYLIHGNTSMKHKGFEDERYLGIWHTADSLDLKNILYNSDALFTYDSLGYVDKDLESELKGVLDNVEV